MPKRRERTGSFSAYDADGRKYTVHVYTDIIDVGNRRAPGAEEKGMKSLRTSDGQSVNYIEKGKYEIVSGLGNIPITSDDSDAL